MPELISGILILVGCWMGYKMGRGEKITMPVPQGKTKFVVRTEAQEAEIEEKLKRGLGR